jgi:dCTP deaminase
MILADSAILQEIENGNIYLSPYDPKSLGSNSYDVHLSPKLAVYRDVCVVHSTPENPVVSRWEDSMKMVPKSAHFLDSKLPNPVTQFEIPATGFLLMPGILYLGSTVEFTRTRGLVPYLEGKSSMGRLGIKVHVTAGKGDIGFEGHWTLEIEVTHPVMIYPGMAVAQLTYYAVKGFCINPYNKKKEAKYNTALGDDDPIASRNSLNFALLPVAEYFREARADSGIAGIDLGEDAAEALPPHSPED